MCLAHTYSVMKLRGIYCCSMFCFSSSQILAIVVFKGGRKSFGMKFLVFMYTELFICMSKDKAERT